jgi:hypothetical protein
MIERRVLAACLAITVVTALVACSDDGGSAGGMAGSGSLAGASSAAGSAGMGTAGVGGASSGGTSGGASSSAGTAGNVAGQGGTSGAGTAGAAGSSGSGGSALMPAKPTMVGDEWALTLGEVTLQVAPQKGGRITTFKLGSENLLTGPAVNPTYWGSTMWIAPEATLWMQPPPAPIDSDPYTAVADDTTLTLSGMTYAKLGVSATKVFSTDAQKNAFKIEYKLNNTSQAAVKMSPWEVSRVLPRGLTFLPKGPSVRESMNATMPTTESNGIVWYEYDMTKVTNDSKLWFDAAEGWVAHVAAGLVFIKAFSDLSGDQIAPMEGDAALYTNALHTYVEIEALGPYVSIAPGASASWTVSWYLRKLPAEIEVKAGNAALAQFVRDTIK